MKLRKRDQSPAGSIGLPIHAGFADTPFGRGLLAKSGKEILHLSFVDSGKEKAAWSALEKSWPNSRWIRCDASAQKVARQIFKKGKNTSAMQVAIRGTPFQQRVWKELLKIPFGTRVSYGTIAKRIGKPKASRAVGTAVGKNRIAFLIPCHRVVRENGDLGGYRWGTSRKSKMMFWERELLSKGLNKKRHTRKMSVRMRINDPDERWTEKRREDKRRCIRSHSLECCTEPILL